ncbi:MAG: type II CRISPR-associated endonuclease Cas1, partial [Planctomycetes bacterium]|nr:type II CRISPR-associated endonuclease Cas1 [Planctomycetota bacterium]
DQHTDSAPAHLTTQHRQLLLKRDGEIVGSIPCEDLGMVVVDHPGTTYSHAALTSLLDSGAALVVCGRDHLPKGMLLPFADHSQVVWRLDEQISASAPLKKRLWKQVVQAKILAQAENLKQDSPPWRKLQQFARDVRSGDTSNREAQAAKVYWSAWLVNPDVETDEAELSFRRHPDGGCPNSLLNYGYAIMRV